MIMDTIIRAFVICFACIGFSVVLGAVAAYFMARDAFEREIDAPSVADARLQSLARWETSTGSDTQSRVWWAGGASISNYERKRMN